ncbi:uncharacterized protein BT62DRAFT_902218, partial [Guyanagaster necrorhizus]
HIIFQKETNQADRVAFVNQICPIMKGNSFLYNSDPARHSHLCTQYCDGLHGTLIIYDPDNPHANLYDVDDNSTSILMLSDWYHTPGKQLGFLSI